VSTLESFPAQVDISYIASLTRGLVSVPERTSEGCRRAHSLWRRRDLEEGWWWHVCSPGVAKMELGQAAQRLSLHRAFQGSASKWATMYAELFKREGRLLVQLEVPSTEQSPSIFQAWGRYLSQSPPWDERHQRGQCWRSRLQATSSLKSQSP